MTLGPSMGFQPIDIVINYSDTWLKRTPTGPKKCVRFNQVSALERFCYVSLLENLPKRTQTFCPS